MPEVQATFDNASKLLRVKGQASSCYAGLRQILINRSDFYEEPIECEFAPSVSRLIWRRNFTGANPTLVPAVGWLLAIWQLKHESSDPLGVHLVQLNLISYPT
jgi:hypothetical protein